ncbi:unnamed protein product [Oppiella nova]|uniref:Uncharacterized protein n=1 Tax=Oppiella nova TaxID=334625 RepID=A0A7R9ML72_9ACAR|nr:unnamed protein product [Oppiella nova]CAG2179337.1 unnamed protein product [Oppiella nova]
MAPVFRRPPLASGITQRTATRPSGGRIRAFTPLSRSSPSLSEPNGR